MQSSVMAVTKGSGSIWRAWYPHVGDGNHVFQQLVYLRQISVHQIVKRGSLRRCPF